MKQTRRTEAPLIEICILAGGLSTRMGRDKAKLRLGGKSLLGRIKDVAKKTGAPVRVIRSDIVPRCGPIGGLLTGLEKSATDAVVFLTCDMPLVSAELLSVFLKPGRLEKSIFTSIDGRWGFPLRLPCSALPVVRNQIKHLQFSLQRLAQVLDVQAARIPARLLPELINVNTPDDLKRARGTYYAGRTS